jgi:hypothetical protein
LLFGCGDAPPSAPPSSSPAFALRYEPANSPCLASAAHDVTFKIDPDAPEPVVAVEDNGRVLPVWWPRGFIAGTSDNPVVMDPAGAVVLRNGDRLLKDLPKLHGYDVCFGGGSIYVWPTPLS